MVIFRVESSGVLSDRLKGGEKDKVENDLKFEATFRSHSDKERKDAH